VAPKAHLAREIYVGKQRALYAYVGESGRCWVVEFLEALSGEARARYGVRFKALGDQGQLRGEHSHPWDSQKMKRLAAYKEGGSKTEEIAQFAAFKDNASQSRIPYFPTGEPGVLLMTHGFEGKKEDEIDDEEMNRAIRIRREYVARLAEPVATRRGKRK
jgi:hypothetical protein